MTTNTPATAFLLANSLGLWLAALFGVPTPSAVEYLQGCMVGGIGAVAWQFVKTGAARNDARAKGVKSDDLPRIDLYSLGLALGAAPLGCGMLIWAIHLWKGTADNLWLSAGIFLGVGAISTELLPPLMSWLVPTLLDWLKRLITRALSVFGGAKP